MVIDKETKYHHEMWDSLRERSVYLRCGIQKNSIGATRRSDF